MELKSQKGWGKERGWSNIWRNNEHEFSKADEDIKPQILEVPQAPSKVNIKTTYQPTP